MTEIESTSARDTLERLRRRLKDRYSIERELGRGGMGAVYLARDVKLDRNVALKVLPSEYAVQPMLRDRFLRETRTAASFSHPNIVPVYAVEDSDDLLAYAMGYVEGESLMERLRRAGPLTVRELVKLMQDVAYALAYAHGRGIVHRDIKPDNIMIERASGRAMVMDFGIARAQSSALVVGAGLTRVGEVVGTPEYMSPEQASGDDVDGRSDLYALGLTMMFAATGEIAVTGETTQKVLVKQLTESLASIGSLRADLPHVLVAAIDRCVQKNPDDRFETAEALLSMLDNSQLVTAEIPLPIRLFQQELSTLTLLMLAFVLFTLYVLRLLDSSDGHDEAMFVVVLVFAIVVTRTMQTLREGQRLAVAGFAPPEIMAGIARVMDEHAMRRADLRADPAVVRTRRRTIVGALVMLVAAVFCFRYALHFRTLVRPGLYEVKMWGTALVVLGMFYLGAGTVLLFKSPLRMSVPERLFRWIWLGPIGRVFVRFAGRRVGRAVAPVSSSVGGLGAGRSGSYATRSTSGVVEAVAVAAASDPVAGVSDARVNEARITDIERRLEALERRG
ncbi:MAG: serine/threonine-protein kinase [Gemmatimonas sp.]